MSKSNLYDCNVGYIFLINNLPGINDGASVKNINDKQSKGTHKVSLFIDKNTAMYFDSFGIEYIP